jgi:hypothetical protein
MRAREVKKLRQPEKRTSGLRARELENLRRRQKVKKVDKKNIVPK